MWRNVRGQYQFKTAEVTSDLSAAMFFGGIDLYSVHWVHEATKLCIASIEYTKQNRNLVSSRCYSDFAIVHHSRFCEANRNIWFQGVLLELKYVTSPNGCCTNLSHQKTWRRLSLTSLPPFWIDTYWPRTFLHTFATKLSIIIIIIYLMLGAYAYRFLKWWMLKRDKIVSRRLSYYRYCGDIGIVIMSTLSAFSL